MRKLIILLFLFNTAQAQIVGVIASSKKVTSFVPQNLLVWSEEFDNAAHVKGNTTISADATTAPNSTLTADQLLETIGSGTHQMYQLYSATKDVIYTLSFYVKAVGRSKVQIILLNQSGTSTVDFDLTAETASQVTGTITSVGSGWYRISVTDASSANGNRANVIRLLNDSGSTSYSGDVAKGLYVWGAQINTGAISGYTKTEGTNIP